MNLRQIGYFAPLGGLFLVAAFSGCGASGGSTTGRGGQSSAAGDTSIPVTSGGDTSNPSTNQDTGGATAVETTPAGGNSPTGGASSIGTAKTGGAKSTGGATSATGGAKSTGGAATGGASVAAVTCDEVAANSGSLSSAFQHTTVSVTGKSKNYVITSNWWHQFSGQTVAYTGNSYTIGGTASKSSDSSPSGFPAIFIGNYGSNGNSTGSNLPKKVTELTTIPTYLDTNASSASGQFNITYDVWFSPNGTVDTTNGSPGNGGYFLMVWLYQPTSYQPRGSEISGQAAAISGVTGKWRIWVDGQNGSQPPCVSYVASTNVDSLSFDLNAFIKDARTRGYIADSQQLALVFGGAEIWQGGVGLQLKRFCAIVN